MELLKKIEEKNDLFFFEDDEDLQNSVEKNQKRIVYIKLNELQILLKNLIS